MNGRTLINWGFVPGPMFPELLELATDLELKNQSDDYILEALKAYVEANKPPALIEIHEDPIEYGSFLVADTQDAINNYDGVIAHMNELMRVPTVKNGAIMPDACPAGSQLGTIPVGGVVACENAIHPGFHSADICCSVAITVLQDNVDASTILDAAMKASHFGYGGRSDNNASNNQDLTQLLSTFDKNQFLKGLENRALSHFMTQGDGNHFFFVGELDGKTVIITHHGSRGFGADIYKRGKRCAEQMTSKIANVPVHQSWITADTVEGRDYWEALQAARKWTKLNHYEIHNAVVQLIGGDVEDRFWNEHNFVFQKSDGLFYHAKGATPAFNGFSEDDEGVTLIPLNMAEGVLLVEHNVVETPNTMGFAPHGAGRNLSRTAHIKSLNGRDFNDVLADETKGIDVRFWSGDPDLSELPSAYKDAKKIRSEIERFNLASNVKLIHPLGSIMAGEQKPFWKK